MKQLVQVVGLPFSPAFPPVAGRLVVEPCLELGGGEGGLLGATDEKPEALPAALPPGELGRDWAICSNPLCLFVMCEVDELRASLFGRLSAPMLSVCVCECDRLMLRPWPSQSPLLST